MIQLSEDLYVTDETQNQATELTSLSTYSTSHFVKGALPFSTLWLEPSQETLWHVPNSTIITFIWSKWQKWIESNIICYTPGVWSLQNWNVQKEFKSFTNVYVWAVKLCGFFQRSSPNRFMMTFFVFDAEDRNIFAFWLFLFLSVSWNAKIRWNILDIGILFALIKNPKTFFHQDV